MALSPERVGGAEPLRQRREPFGPKVHSCTINREQRHDREEGAVMKRLIKPVSWLGAVAAVLLLAGAVAARSRTPAAPGAPPPPEVTVITVATQTVAAQYEYVGQAEASRRVEVRSQVTGVIVARPYTEGTDVAQGALLFRIDPTTYEAAYRSAQARLANAQRTLARLKPLLAARAVAKKDYDDTFVRAEIAGRAGRALMELGARITGPGDLLTTVEQVDPIYVNFSPSDEDLLGLRRDIADGRLLLPPGPRALAVRVALADGSLLPAAGELNFADLAVQPATGTLQLRAQLRNPQHALLPGQFVRVRLLGLKRPSAILVPQRAVQQGLTGAFVYVVGDSDKVAARNVVATSWDGGSWLIDQGLKVGDRVVVDGVQKVAPGQPARPVAYRPTVDSGATEAQDSTLIAPPAVPLRIRSRP